MATVTNGTLILRPSASKGVGITTIPSNTAIEECYKLVNEEVADYESTYISMAAGDTIFLRFSLPENIKNVTLDDVATFRICGVYHDPDSGKIAPEREDFCCWSDETTLINVNFISKGDNNSGSMVSVSSDLAYVTDSIINALNNNDLAYVFSIASSAKSTVFADISQIYIEINNVTYEEVSDTELPIFFKQNGSWVSITGTFYQKQNGVWVECDTSVLTSGTQYDIEEL